MSVAGVSIGSTGYVTATSNLTASQQAFLTLQNSLALGNLKGAQAAFNTYQQLNEPTVAAGSAPAASTPFTTDLAALGKAISGGDLTGAQTAFASLQADLKTTPAPTVTAAIAAVEQSVQSTTSLLNFSTPNPAAANSDPLVNLLLTSEGQNPSGTTVDPTVALLESKYGAAAFNSNGTPAASASKPVAEGNGGSGGSVNVYA